MTYTSDDRRTRASAEGLRTRFERAARALGAERQVEEAFASVYERYFEPQRVYHSVGHIESCLALLNEVSGALRSPSEIELALWYHDAIYAVHPLAANEERSAELALAECARMGIGDAEARRIAELVRATKRHEPKDPDDADARVFLDVDLSILGSPPLVYAEFERDVREEYAWLPYEQVYRRTRAKILGGFLTRPAIYGSALLRERLEAAARANLEGALRELLAKDDAQHAHADDDGVFLTRAARLEEQRAWSELYLVSFEPARDGAPAALAANFGTTGETKIKVDLDDPVVAGVVERLRSVPGYSLEREARAAAEGRAALLYSRVKSGRVEGPVPLPARGPSAPYRG